MINRSDVSILNIFGLLAERWEAEDRRGLKYSSDIFLGCRQALVFQPVKQKTKLWHPYDNYIRFCISSIVPSIEEDDLIYDVY
jgi:hypothetical protein